MNILSTTIAVTALAAFAVVGGCNDSTSSVSVDATTATDDTSALPVEELASCPLGNETLTPLGYGMEGKDDFFLPIGAPTDTAYALERDCGFSVQTTDPENVIWATSPDGSLNLTYGVTSGKLERIVVKEGWTGQTFDGMSIGMALSIAEEFLVLYDLQVDTPEYKTYVLYGDNQLAVSFLLGLLLVEAEVTSTWPYQAPDGMNSQ